MQSSESIRPDEQHEGTSDQRRWLGAVQDVAYTDETVRITCAEGVVTLIFYVHDLVRVHITPNQSAEQGSLASTDAILPQQVVTPVVSESDEEVRLLTPSLEITVQKTSFALSMMRRGGSHPFYILEEASFSETGAITVVQPVSPDSHFYGLGEKTGHLDKRHESYAMWNSDVYDPHVPEIEALYVSIPFLIHKSDGGVTGVLLDNPGRSRFDMRNRTDAYVIQTETGAADLYVMPTQSLTDLVKRYTDLTGRMAMPPKWAIGYHQSRYSYMSADEVLELARTFREKQIPCDTIYLDIHYMNGYRVFTFDEERFPNPNELTAALHEMGIRLVPIIDPGVKVDEAYGTYQQGVAEDVFCKTPDGEIYTGEVWPGESAFPDFLTARVRGWWGEQQRTLLENGIDGVWNDMNEPAIFDGPAKTMEGDTLHENNGQPVAHEQVHNLYGMMMAKASWEGQQAVRPEVRPFVLTRSGYAGIQRYGAVWTGDNRSFWEHMAMAIPMVLNLGLSGVAFTGPDVGGFAHHTNGELLARWTQMGALFPYYRNHSALDTLYQEPWRFGEEVEQICRAGIELRYRWLPHLYSLFYQASQSGLPVLRPLCMYYPDDPETAQLSDEFLFGESVLVAPVLQPGKRHRLVYLPEGEWMDYWTGERIYGGDHIIAEAPLDRLPLYLKAGAILPQTALVQSTAEMPDGPLVVEIFAGSEGTSSSFQVYEDDGITTAYQRGAYALTEIGWDYQPDRATVHVAQLHQGYQTPWQGLELRIRGLGVGPSSVIGCQPIDSDNLAENQEPWSYDEAGDTLTIVTALPIAAEDIVILTDD